MGADRKRVLILAESCNPDESSVSLEGWSLSRALVEHADVHVVTHPRNRNSLLKAGWSVDRDFTIIDPAVVERPVSEIGEKVRSIAKLGWTWTTALTTFWYYYFEHLVWRRFGKAIRAGHFDVIHRLNPVSPPTPSPIAAHCRDAGTPFVWGPINGGIAWPKEFLDAMRREGEWLSYVRDVYKLFPAYLSTRRTASALIVGSTSVWDQMKPYRDRCVYIPENAIDPARFASVLPRASVGPLRVAFVGRLVPFKGADMLIDAAAPLVRSGRVVVDVIGDGPEMGSLRRRVEEASLQQGVLLPGWVDHRALAERLSGSQVFGFPSVREFGGAVVLEAMALGLVPVVIDYGGPGEHVTNETGFRVPIGPREEIVRRFREVLTQLADSPGQVRSIGEKARQRVYHLFTWDMKARQVLDVYRWVTGQGPKPDFGMPFP